MVSAQAGTTGQRLQRVAHLLRAPSRLLRRPADLLVCIVCGVTRLNVYIPDELAAAARQAGLNLSQVAQEALRRRLDASSTDAWLATLEPLGSNPVDHDRAVASLDQVRDEPTTRHG